MKTTQTLYVIIALTLLACGSANEKSTTKQYKESELITISKTVLQDKIKGGWAGQVIGCTYGGPTEFKFNGTMIGDQVPIQWNEDLMLWWYENSPGLYDDVYMDLTFVDIFEKHGLDAHDSLHALAFARAQYPLWHANQAARYNILNGIMPPASGHWKNNPHADDIDFQIEADFAGLMAPGMVNSATSIGNRIGHIMNYGDGVYGGIYVAAMYALAFVHDDVEYIVEHALTTIPSESEFHQCISDVIGWYRQYPTDWKSTWFEAQKKWTADKGCTDGVFKSYNIDAKINAAYIVIGLLYGEGDYGKTIDISTRCGYDSDCNPANAGGILGTMIGYDNIPAYWKQGLDKVEDLNFSFTEMSLTKVYQIGFNHALKMVERNGGSITDNDITIAYQTPKVLPMEKGFDGVYPLDRKQVSKNLDSENNSHQLAITGCGYVLTGRARKINTELPDITLEVDVLVDDQLIERIKLPTSWLIRKYEVAWKYDLPEGNHTIKINLVDVPKGYDVQVFDVITYSEKNPGSRVHF